MKNIIESLNNLYAEKLMNWQLEGRNIDSCYEVIEKVEYIKEREKSSLTFNWDKKIGSFCIPKPLDKEITNWILGYCKLNNVEVKVNKSVWLDKDNIKHESEGKDFIYLFFIY